MRFLSDQQSPPFFNGTSVALAVQVVRRIALTLRRLAWPGIRLASAIAPHRNRPPALLHTGRAPHRTATQVVPLWHLGSRLDKRFKLSACVQNAQSAPRALSGFTDTDALASKV